MALSNPRGQFGVHDITFYSRSTGLSSAHLRVIGECTLNLAAEYTDLEGGSQKYIWDSEISKIGSELSLTGREYESGTMSLLLGGSLVENAAEATGAVDGLANVNGTSIVSASTGIHTVSVYASDYADLKEGKYILKATAAKVLSLYCLTDVDFSHGTDTTFDDDDLLVEENIDVTSGDVQLATFGLNIEVGSGTTAFTINDTAEFYVRKANTESIELTFGQSSAEFTECGVIIYGQKQSDGSVTSLELFKCKVGGMPISFSEKAWSEWSVTIKALYDSSKDAIGCFRRTIAA